MRLFLFLGPIDISISGEYTYVASHGSGLLLIYISEPTTARFRRVYPPLGNLGKEPSIQEIPTR
ncbi:MAG TPA: hypothetical protein EYQ50_02250 [Verrucomicrobiales bacterium]|nr:hypothetical protein [Verrucomicrobiales bacterium]HIL70280.1 hypothetical protein [Verrucomicrobiota bacterium]